MKLQGAAATFEFYQGATINLDISALANEEFSANGYTAADVSVTLIFADVDHTQYKDDLNLTADAIGSIRVGAPRPRARDFRHHPVLHHG